MITPISDLDDAPEFAHAAFNATRQRAPKTEAPIGEVDTASAIAKAIDYLTHNAPEAIEGAGGDETTYKVAARLRDFGLSIPVAFDLLAEHWNEAGKAIPPWPADELRQKVDNAFAYATGAWGGMSGLNEFDDVSDFLEPEKRPRLYWIPSSEAIARSLEQLADPLVEGLIDQQSLAVIYGASNSGKTFVTLDIAYHIAAGRPWQGRETAKGLVAYVAAEGGRGIYKRLAALDRRYAWEDVAFALIPCPIDLLNSRTDTKDLIALIEDAAARFGREPRLIVIDTLSRALAGGDENASTDMGGFIKNVDRIREATKATMCVVHHTGKDAARGARGWSGLRGAIDTEIEIVDSVIKVSKQRDLDPIADLRFKLKTMEIGKDAKGRGVTTCTVEIVTGSEFIKIEPNATEQEMLDAFLVAAREKQEANGGDLQEQIITTDEWEEVYLAQLEDESKRIPGVRQRTRIRTRLVALGHLKKVKHAQWVAVD